MRVNRWERMALSHTSATMAYWAVIEWRAAAIRWVAEAAFSKRDLEHRVSQCNEAGLRITVRQTGNLWTATDAPYSVPDMSSTFAYGVAGRRNCGTASVTKWSSGRCRGVCLTASQYGKKDSAPLRRRGRRGVLVVDSLRWRVVAARW